MKNSKESIFVVDDDQGILDSFDVMLGDEYNLVMIDNGTKAIELLGKEIPRLIFLDIKMPAPNGLEVLKNIRKKAISAKVVIVTALVQDSFFETANRYGIYRYLNKPLDVDEVEDIARRVLH
ncbi:MAG: response regulator [Thermodesulfobacteriota bacterium]|nr:response regulator [Thermodesulfobacteriota bacterium]